MYKEKFVGALKAKYEAQYKEAEATIQVYLNNPVAIGEHPQHVEDMDKLIASMTDARDKLETIKDLEKENNPGLLVEST